MTTFADRNRAAMSPNAPGRTYLMGYTVLAPARSFNADAILATIGMNPAQWCLLDRVAQVRALEAAIRTMNGGFGIPLDQAEFDSVFVDLQRFCRGIVSTAIVTPWYAKSPGAAGDPPGAQQYLDADGNPTNVPPAFSVPSVSQSYARPSSNSPTVSGSSQPEQQWVQGVPNWLTGVTAVAVAYAAWKTFGGEK